MITEYCRRVLWEFFKTLSRKIFWGDSLAVILLYDIYMHYIVQPILCISAASAAYTAILYRVEKTIFSEDGSLLTAA